MDAIDKNGDFIAWFQSQNIVGSWCLLKFFTMFDRSNSLFMQTLNELRDQLLSIAGMQVENADSATIRSGTLRNLWAHEEGENYPRNPQKVAQILADKCSAANIQHSEEQCNTVAKEFINGMEALVELLTNGNAESIDSYLAPFAQKYLTKAREAKLREIFRAAASNMHPDGD